MRFRDRVDAGRQLAAALLPLAPLDGIVLAVPRGGVPVGAVVADALRVPLDVLVTRKLGIPGNEECGMGAVAEGGAVVVDDRTVAMCGITPAQVRAAVAREQAEVERRVRRWRHGAPLDVAGKTVIVVDDGIATGGTVHAALQALRARKPARIVLAVPVAPPTTLAALAGAADAVVCLATPRDFGAVGSWYRDFTQVSDDEVSRLLAAHAGPPLATEPA